MAEFTEAFWVPHCDDESCCLGGFHYDCPVCGKGSTDYGIWWLFDDLLVHRSLKEHDFCCDRCKAPLTVYYESAEYETRVRAKV